MEDVTVMNEDNATPEIEQGGTEEEVVTRQLDPLEVLLNEDPEFVPTKTVPVMVKSGKTVPWTIRQLSDKEYDQINRRALRPGKNGKVSDEIDVSKFQTLIVHAATVNPNLNDPRLLKKFNVPVSEELVNKILPVGQRANLAGEIMELTGFIDELTFEAKN